MKKSIITIGFDQSMVSELHDRGYKVTSHHGLFKGGPAEVVICSSEIVPPHELERLTGAYPDSTVFYFHPEMNFSGFQQLDLLCSSHGIELLPPYSTADSIARRLDRLNQVATKSGSNLVGFFGTAGGVGVTSIAGEFAGALAARKLNVLMLGLDLYDPGWNGPPPVSLDQWRSRLNGRVLMKSDFDQCVRVNGFLYLPGNYDYIGAQDYTEENIENLLDLAMDAFDVVVADFGSYPNSAAWAVGMQRSSYRYLVTHPNHKERADRLLDVMAHLGVQRSALSLIVNRSDTYSDSGITPKILSNELRVPLLVEIGTATAGKQMNMNLTRTERRKIEDHAGLLAGKLRGDA